MSTLVGSNVGAASDIVVITTSSISSGDDILDDYIITGHSPFYLLHFTNDDNISSSCDYVHTTRELTINFKSYS